MNGWSNRQKSYYKSQASKRLAVICQHIYTELETGLYLDVYKLCDNASINLRWMLNKHESNIWRAQRIWGRGLHCYPEFTIGNDIVDFADPTAKIVIEVDSSLHNANKDAKKDERLANAGYRVIRINKRYTKQDPEYIEATIQALEDHGKETEKIKKIRELELNDERVIIRLSKELAQANASAKSTQGIGEIKLITLAEFMKTDEFMRYMKYSVLTDDVRKEIESIPLFLDDTIS